MLLGLYLSFSRWRSFLPLYLFIVIHTGIHLLSWPAPRYRLSVDAVLMVFAGLALLELFKQLNSWRRSCFLDLQDVRVPPAETSNLDITVKHDC